MNQRLHRIARIVRMAQTVRLGKSAFLVMLSVAALAGCGMFGGPDEPAAGGEAGATTAANGGVPGAGGSGLLNTIGTEAPKKSPSRLLGRLASDFGWEDQVAQNVLLKKAVADEDFDERVEPYLFSLFFNNGFSVLPVVGEGHQFTRDSLVRGALANTRVLVATRNKIRIIFVNDVEDVTLVYPRDGEPPQVFTLDEEARITIRKSLLDQYIR